MSMYTYVPPSQPVSRWLKLTSKIPSHNTIFVKVPLAVALIGNPLLAWQHYTYVNITINPLSHPALSANQARITLREDFGILVTLAFFLSLFNGVLAAHGLRLVLMALGNLREYLDLRSPWSWTTTRYLWRTFTVLIMLVSTALALTFTFVQFVSPFVTPEVAWERKYRNVCDGLNIRAFMDSAESRPASSVLFADIQGMDSSYRMRMTETDDGRSNFSVVSVRGGQGVSFKPNYGSVLFNYRDRHLQGLSSDGEVLLDNFFDVGSKFAIDELGLEGDAGPFSRRCVFDPTVEVRKRGEGKIVMRTAQFAICGQLQLCAAREEAEKVQVVVGLLALMRRGRPGGCCKGSVVPGVAGRDAGWNGEGRIQ